MRHSSLAVLERYLALAGKGWFSQEVAATCSGPGPEVNQMTVLASIAAR
jgi:hypothetical protein